MSEKSAATGAGEKDEKREPREKNALGEAMPDTVTLHIISDSRGVTARGVVNSAAVQFSSERVRVSTLSGVSDIQQVAAYLDRYVEVPAETAVFHTVLDDDLRAEIRMLLNERGIASVDLLGPSLKMLAQLLGEQPLDVPGLVVNRETVAERAISADELAHA